MEMEFQKIEFRDNSGNYINGFKLFNPTSGIAMIPRLDEHIVMFSQFHGEKRGFVVTDVIYDILEYRIRIILKLA